MTAAERIRDEIQSVFDIPFEVSEGRENSEPSFTITPLNDGEEFFSLHVSFKMRIRITLEYLPQRYSAGFVRAMGRRGAEARSLFSGFADELLKRGAKISFTVNHAPLNVLDGTEWPDEWSHLSLRVTKSPVCEGEPDYVALAVEWASLVLGMVLSLADIVPIDDMVVGYAEGDRKRVLNNRYERNPLNRELCLSAKGYLCAICGFDFEKIYGDIGYHFIHVHHIIPVSKVGPGYIIDPVKDLIPVCPNCHAMLHRVDPPMLPEELQQCLKNSYSHEV